ncbi:MAG: T9SS type A sorting domain-containing protein [Ignavibacteria bacterium]|nr:T9SS type A sorting domain-containing protein [Ignavibacteria bacterium]
MIDLLPLTTIKQGPDDFIYALNGGYTTAGRLYRIKPDLSGISNNNIPVGYKLEQNYPNPFNPVTSIKYEIPKTGFVTLKIFNALGMELTALVNETKQQGSYEVSWDASNFSSGVYFYELSARQNAGSSTGEFTERRKMVLIK